MRAPIERLLTGVDAEMSPWRPDSALSRFNRGQAGTRGMPRETVLVAEKALALASASGGHFDPTVGPLVARWGFGPIFGNYRQGWRQLAIAGDAIEKHDSGVTLDICGIAKGRALDRMVLLLADAGHGDFVIDLGGELVGHGRHPSGRVWRVGIEDPRPGIDGIVEILELDGKAVATSGDRTNGYSAGERRYSHIIDPRKGEPVESALASVSVIAEDAMTADGWTTALMAAGATEGPSLARRKGLAVLFLIRESSGLRRVSVGAFDRYLA